MAAALDADALANLQDRLLELEGVLHAGLDRRSNDLWIVRDPAHDHAPIELAVQNRIAALGHDPAGLNVRVTLPMAAGPRRRVRFESVDRAEENGRVGVTVSLEWNGTVHSGSAFGEKGPAMELKTTARAAVAALEKLIGQPLDVRIIGLKAIHAFDSDLMVASLLRADGGHQRLVGAVVVTDGGTLEAASLAVLSALNRTLGNFLHASD